MWQPKGQEPNLTGMHLDCKPPWGDRDITREGRDASFGSNGVVVGEREGIAGAKPFMEKG